MSDARKDNAGNKQEMARKEWSKPELIEIDAAMDDVENLAGPIIDGVENISS